MKSRTLRLLTNASIATLGDATCKTKPGLQALGLDDNAIADLVSCLELRDLSLSDEYADKTESHSLAAQSPASNIVLLEDDSPSAEHYEINRTASAILDDQRYSHIDHGSILDEAMDTVAERVFGTSSNPATERRKKFETDKERATRFASTSKARIRRGPRLDNAADLERLREIKNCPVMDVPDAAWLYGISTDAVYCEVKRGGIPHHRFGDRVKILTAHVLAELFPSLSPLEIEQIP